MDERVVILLEEMSMQLARIIELLTVEDETEEAPVVDLSGTVTSKARNQLDSLD